MALSSATDSLCAPSYLKLDIEESIGFLNSNTPSGKIRRVSEYLGEKRNRDSLNRSMPEESKKAQAIIIGCTIGGAMVGAGIGAGIGSTAMGMGAPIGAAVGAGVGGAIGFSTGTFIAYHVVKEPVREHYNFWKSQLRNEICLHELKKITKEHPSFEGFLDPVSQERFEMPLLITTCGHTFESTTMASIIAKSIILDPECPLCRQSFKKEQTAINIGMIGRMQEVYSKLALETGESGKYSPEVSQAFIALSCDTKKQMVNIFTDACNHFAEEHRKGKISFSAYKLEMRQLEDHFEKYL